MFYQAVVFNQDVSKWNTGAVTNMQSSTCNLSPLCVKSHVFRCCVFLRRQLAFHLTNSQTFFICFCFATVLVVVVVGCSFFLFVAPFFAVFHGEWGKRTVFNQDVSKWNTGAVTNMRNSK